MHAILDLLRLLMIGVLIAGGFVYPFRPDLGRDLLKRALGGLDRTSCIAR
jgi:hypothetical protein